MRFSVITAAIFGSTIALAHMEMSDPPPFRSKKNTHANQNTIDYSMTSPLDGAGGKLCKGYEVDFADATGVGAATGTYPQGSDQAVTMMGSARHDGGSCQISLSTDSGKSFTVLQSVMGGCPGADGSKIPFKVPSDAPVGRAILSWSWQAHTGGRPETYHNCAAIEITTGSGPTPSVAFSARPAMFIANIGTGCSTVGGKDPRYPNPGPDVVGTGDESSTTGNCGSATPGGAPVPEQAAPEAPASSANPGIPIASSSTSGFSFVTSTGSPVGTTLATSTLPTSSAAGSISTGTPSTGFTVSTDGTCGADKKCPESTCCSSSGYCGSSTAHCGTGCQAGFGTCSGGNSTIKGRVLAGRIKRN